MNDFINYLKRNSYTHLTIATMQRTMVLYNKWLQHENLTAEQVNYRDILSFIKYQQNRGTSQRTIQHYLGSIRHYYNHLIEEKKVNNNPITGIKVQGVKRKTLYHIFQPHELSTIYNNHKDETLKGRRDKIILGLMIYQGLRAEELGRLEINQIKLREGEIEVLGGIRRNGRKMKLEAHQIMKMYDYILKVRPEILQKSKQETDKLLISPEGSTQVSNFLSRLMTRLKKQHPQLVNAKQIRASVITKWLKMYNLREVQYLSGHKYISSTESFMQNEMEGLQEEVQQYHPLG